MRRQSKLIDVLVMGIALFWFLATFSVRVGPSSNLAEAQLGNYSETIAGGSFVREDEKYQYKGGTGNITEIKIRDDGRFSVKAKGLDLSSISLDSRVNPVNFDLQFGGYRGKTEIQLDKRGRFREKDRYRNKKGRQYRKGKSQR